MAVAVLFLGALALATARPGTGADEDYRAVFGDRYTEAERYLLRNPWMAEALRLPAEETAIALAVVFPETVRYSDLQDKIQIHALKVLYVQYGRKYANFSVGHFQMKPSFIEQLEADWNRLTAAEERSAAGIPAFDKGDQTSLRNARILRLDDEHWQVAYLRIFMAVMRKKYGHIVFKDTEDRLRFYATAYNAGYTSGEKRLRLAMQEKRFHLELYSPKKTYNYADIAVSFFRRRSAL